MPPDPHAPEVANGTPEQKMRWLQKMATAHKGEVAILPPLPDSLPWVWYYRDHIWERFRIDLPRRQAAANFAMRFPFKTAQYAFDFDRRKLGTLQGQTRAQQASYWQPDTSDQPCRIVASDSVDAGSVW
jgi:hypothetical protein